MDWPGMGGWWVVEVSVDEGKTWRRAKLQPRLGIFAWHKFTIEMTLDVGVYIVYVRAIDCLGNEQHLQLQESDWNYASMCDDASQRIDIIVVDHLTFTE